MGKNIFKSFTHEFGNFFGTNADNRGHGTIQSVFKDIGQGVHEIITIPEHIIQSAGDSIGNVISQVGTSGSQVLDSAGGALEKGAQGLGGLAQGLTLPLLIGGGALIGFTFLNR